MGLYQDIDVAVGQIIAKYKEAAVDGLTLGEVFTLAQNAVATLVQLTEKYGGFSGAEKKEAVLAALDRLYDEVIAPIDIAQIPNWIEPMFDKFAKQLILYLADSWINSLVNVFNKTGWGSGQSPAPAPTPGGPEGPAVDPPTNFTPY